MVKKTISLFIITLMAMLLIIGCTSSGEQTSSGKLSLSQVTDNWMIGIGDSEGTDLMFRGNGDFEIMQGDDMYYGTWEYDETRPMYNYTVRWTEGDSENGYLMDFIQEDGVITVLGQWFLSDMYAPMSLTVKFKE